MVIRYMVIRNREIKAQAQGGSRVQECPPPPVHHTTDCSGLAE